MSALRHLAASLLCLIAIVWSLPFTTTIYFHSYSLICEIVNRAEEGTPHLLGTIDKLGVELATIQKHAQNQKQMLQNEIQCLQEDIDTPEANSGMSDEDHILQNLILAGLRKRKISSTGRDEMIHMLGKGNGLVLRKASEIFKDNAQGERTGYGGIVHVKVKKCNQLHPGVYLGKKAIT
ncbi:hypothetical protein BDQ17DRAFT_1327122 [Cyathus striatus]|nr:hypothetical protein BDQ17DRAFT_1327122 [Cyathus striatus]